MGSLTRGERNIQWIETHCRIPEGKFVGQPVKLRPFQKKDLKKIYDNPAGATRTAIISYGRKNAKTTFSAFLLLLHLCGPEAKVNSQLVSTALSREQAALVFELAAKMVRMSPAIAPVVGIRDTNKQFYCTELGTVYRALSADAKRNVGGSPVFAIHDELGQNKGPRSELYEAVETGMGAHEAPLSVIISTQAPTDADLLSVLIDDALAGHDPHTVISLYTAPEEDNPFLASTIKKANPAYGDFLSADELKKQAQNAKRMPSREPAYRNLVLNQRVDAKSVFVAGSVWKQCGEIPRQDFGRLPVYGGLDLSATTDLTALTLMAEDNGKWDVHCRFWLPEDGIREKAQRDRVPYDTWADKGYLTLTPGKTIEYSWVAYELRRIFDSYNIAKIGFDRWNWKFLKPWLIEAGFRDEELDKFVEFGQGYQSMSPALRELEGILLSGRMRHGMHPILTMCAHNAVVQMDPSGNRKLAKDKSNGRIDGLVALTQSVGVKSDAEQPTYVTGRLRTI